MLRQKPFLLVQVLFSFKFVLYISLCLFSYYKYNFLLSEKKIEAGRESWRASLVFSLYREMQYCPLFKKNKNTTNPTHRNNSLMAKADFFIVEISGLPPMFFSQ